MRTLYLECNMGAAGDMLMAALLEVHPNPHGFIEKLNGLLIPGVSVNASSAVKCGIKGTHISVMVNDDEEKSLDADGHIHEHEHHVHHHHSGMHKIEHILSHLDLPEQVRVDVMAVYHLIAEAESHVHGRPVSEIHFHEVGTMDAITDIVGVCWLLHELHPDQILASPVHVGVGQVCCAHGILPVPAPATAYILRGIPTYGGPMRGELCTPTGAALLKHFASDFISQPAMRISQIGYGMGNKNFEVANCVRAMLGETEDPRDSVVELCCNLDDMTPEAMGFATEQLLAGGALDVYTTSVGMKKNRPGTLLSCLCRTDQRESMVRLIFKYTTTIGIREYNCKRYTLARTTRTVETEYGPVRFKHAGGWGVTREKPEFEDIAKIARKKETSLIDTVKLLENGLKNSSY